MNEQSHLIELPVGKSPSRAEAACPSHATESALAEPSETPKPRRLKRLLLGAGALALIAAGADFGWQYWTVGRFQESTDDAYVQADSTIIAPKVSGYLSAVPVADNQPVKAGEPLARIDDRDYVVALKQATANVAAAKAAIEAIDAGVAQQGAVIDEARATVALDQANLTFAEQENDRYAALGRSGAGTVQNAEQATSRLSIAQATLARDGAAVAAAESQIGVLRAERAKAEAEREYAEAAAEQARLNLSYTTIAAPVDGKVGDRTLRVGQYVQAGTALMSVVPLADVYVVANFKETQLADVRPGQPVTIDVDSFPDHAVKGVVDSLAPASGQEFALLPPDNATGNFTKIVQRIPVKIRVAAGDALAGRLLPGMSVVPTIDTKAE